MVKEDLVVFSIGPVQSFITTARRTQDLWLGSRLLSQLALVGVKKAEDEGADFIFPAQSGGKWPQSVPNVFVVSVPEDEGQELCEKMEREIRAAWDAVARTVCDWLNSKAPTGSWRSIWEGQVKEWLAIYWVVWPWDGENYGLAYRRSGLALDARKQIRHYPKRPEPDETCTLCGLRQALRIPHEGAEQLWNPIWQNLNGIGLREREQLCTICTIKRFASQAKAFIGGERIEDDERFPSTSSVAAAIFRAKLLERWDDLQDVVNAHLQTLKELRIPHTPFDRGLRSPYLKSLTEGKVEADELLRYDGDFFYPETFSETRMKDVLGRSPTKEDMTRAFKSLGTLNELLGKASKKNIAPPHTYYAVLVMDGDKMGKMLGSLPDPKLHGKISSALAGFAQDDVPRIVETEHAGRVIYAGGDDILALLPVAHALSAANSLRKCFTQTMEKVLEKVGEDVPEGVRQELSEPRTASAGIAIAHHLQPLGMVMKDARRSEHKAKDTLNRNAIAVSVIRRSGGPLQVGAKWCYEGVMETMTTIQSVQDAMQEGLSGKVAYDLQSEAKALAKIEDAWEPEIKRLLTRHWEVLLAEGESKEEAKARVEEEVKTLAHLLAGLAKQIGIGKLADWLLLARFLAQGGKE